MRVKKSFVAPLLVLTVFILKFISGFIPGSVGQGQDGVYLSIIIITLLVFAPPGIFYCRMQGEGYFKKLKLRLFSPQAVLLILAGLATVLFGSTLLSLGVYYLSSGSSEFIFPRDPYSAALNTDDPLQVLLAMAVLPAVTEEFIFRGIVLSEYEENGNTIALLMSSLLFAMVHFSLPQFAVYLLGGAVFGLVAIVTRSLLASVLLHAAYNGLNLYMQRYLERFMQEPQSTVLFIFTLATLFLISLFCFFSAAERCCYRDGLAGVPAPAEPNTAVPKPKLLLEALISPTFLLCVLVFVIASLVQ